MSTEPSTRTCQICHCSELAPCPGGCAWVSDDLDVCDACIETATEKALRKLQLDSRTVALDATRYDLFCVLATLQLAARHPYAEDSPTVQRAVRFGRRLQQILGAGHPVLNFVCQLGWNKEFDQPIANPQIPVPDRRIIIPP